MSSPNRSAVARTGAAAASLGLVALLAACSNGEVEVGDARTNNTGPILTSSPSASPTLSEYLDPQPSVLGDVTLHLPLGWTAYEGQPVATAGTDADVQGALQVSALPAEGSTAEQWAEAIVAGETDLVEKGDALALNDPLTAPGDRPVLHISHDHADGLANFFVAVEADTLYLLRFSGDGSTRAQLAAAESASTMTIQLQARPTDPTTPMETVIPETGVPTTTADVEPDQSEAPTTSGAGAPQ